MKKKFSMVPLTKKMVPVLLSAVFLLPLATHAEIKAGSVELSPFVGYNFFDNQHNLKNRPVYGGRIGYNFSNNFGIEGTGEFSKTRTDDNNAAWTEQGQFTGSDDVKITSYHLDLLYHFMPTEKFNPFVVAGYGASHYNPEINDKNMRLMNFGVGAKYWVADNVALRVDLRDKMTFDEHLHNLSATAGIVFAFGGDEKAGAAATTVAPADNTAPTVVFTSPPKGASAVAANQKTNIAFSEKMDPATITAKTFTLKQGTTPVAGKVTSSDATATFTPASDMEKNKLYTATITSAAKDPAGNALASNYEWGFTTGLPNDTTAPTVIFTSPVKGATAAPVNQKVQVAFSEPVDPATITATTMTVKQGATPVPGKVTADAAVATFTPANNFEKGKVYTGTMTTGAKDLAGNPLASNYVWDFTAHAAPNLVPAVLVTLEDSHFLFNSAEISENGKTILNLNSQTLKDNPQMKIRIAGYASAAGTEAYNQGLSERRANAVRDYLVKEGGISSNRLTTIGYGETSPSEYEAVPSDIYSEAAKANMKVLFEIIVK